PSKSAVPETATTLFLESQPKPFRIAPMFLDLWPNSSEMFQLEDIRSHFGSEAIYRAMMHRIDPTSWSGTSTVITFNSLHFNFGAVVWERAFTPEDIGVLEKVYVPLRPFARKGESVALRVTTQGVKLRVLRSVPLPGDDPLFYGRVKTPLIFDRQLPDGRFFL